MNQQVSSEIHHSFNIFAQVHILMSSAIISPGLIAGEIWFLAKFQNQFCACSAQPGKKRESGLLFNIKMPAFFQFRY